MIRLEGLKLSYPGATEEVLSGIDISFSPGERVVLAGRNGSGKSTFLRLLAGILQPTGGSIRFENSDNSITAGIVQQNPGTQLIASTVEKEIAFGLENRAVPTEEIRRRVDETLKRTGLEEFRHRSPHRLSAGEMQRVAFAAVLAMNPVLWLLDEPAAFLDPEERERIIGLLELIPDDSILIFAAGAPEDYEIGDRLLVLHKGRIHADGAAGELYSTGALRDAGLLEPRGWRLQKILEGKSGSTDYVETSEAKSIPIAGDFDPKVHSGQVKPLYSEVSKSDLTLKVTGIKAWRKELFGSKREVLKDVNLQITGGEIVALVGANGSGKTTLIEVLAGLADHWEGQVSWGGEKPEKLRGKIGVAFQFPERSFFAETVLEEVAFGPRNLGKDKKEADEIAVQSLSALGLDPSFHGKKSPFELSKGEARRAALAAIRALQPVAYLLDEPTAGLDSEGCDFLARMLQEDAVKGCIILIAGHDTERFIDWASRFVLLENGRLVHDADPREWWNDSREDFWKPPAVVKAWREAGRSLNTLSSLKWKDMVGSVEV